MPEFYGWPIFKSSLKAFSSWTPSSPSFLFSVSSCTGRMIDLELRIPEVMGWGGSLAALAKLSLLIWPILWMFCLKLGWLIAV